jgi:hypothetical protein
MQEAEGPIDTGGEVMAAGLSLHPEDDPSIPTPQPDVSIFGMLGKVSYAYIYLYRTMYTYMNMSSLYPPLVSISPCLKMYSYIGLYAFLFVCISFLINKARYMLIIARNTST